MTLVRSDLGAEEEDPDYFYAAVDPDDNVFYLALCNFEDLDLGSKLFLASHPNQGSEMVTGCGGGDERLEGLGVGGELV